LTANAFKSDRKRCLDAGMDGFLAKPIRAEELFAAIATAVSPQTGHYAQPASEGPLFRR
jgi:CheY-like chemotaxis protein